MILTGSHFVFSREKNVYWKPGGLLNEVCLTLYIRAFSLIFSLLFDPEYFYKLYKRKQFIKNPEKYLILQKEANKLFTGANFQIEVSFSKLISYSYLVGFFIPMYPLASILLLIVLIIFFFIEKILFARIYAKPQIIGGRLAVKALYKTGLLIFIIYVNQILKKAGELFLDYILERDRGLSFYFLLVCMIISGLIRYIFGSQFSSNQTSYDTKQTNLRKNKDHLLPYSSFRHEFHSEYERSNPMTAKNETRKYIHWLMSKLIFYKKRELKLKEKLGGKLQKKWMLV